MNKRLKAIREELVLRHMAVEQQGLVEEVLATFARPRYDIVATNTLFDGEARVRERIELLAAAMPGVLIEPTQIHFAENAVIVETRSHGVHSGPLLGIAPTGKPYNIRGVAIFRFDGEELVEETVYYDRLTLIDQISPKP